MGQSKLEYKFTLSPVISFALMGICLAGLGAMRRRKFSLMV